MNKDNQLHVDDSLFNIGSITNAKFEWFEPGYHYQLIEMDGSQYIRIDSKRPCDYKKKFLDYGKLSKDKDLLFNLLVCIDDIFSIDWSNIESCINIEKLFRWCHKYGIPCSAKNERVWFRKDGYAYVLFEPACKIIAIICLIYNLWNAVKDGNIDKFKKIHIKIIENDEYKILRLFLLGKSEILLEELKECFDYFLRNTLSFFAMRRLFSDTLREILNYYVSHACHMEFRSMYLSEEITEDSTVDKTIYYDLTPFVEISVFTNSPLDLCFFHLLSIVNFSGSGKQIKECGNCHETFWAKNGHSKYCSNCDRRKVWYNSHRK